MINVFESDEYLHKIITIYKNEFVFDADSIIAIKSIDHGNLKRFNFNKKTKKLTFFDAIRRTPGGDNGELLHFVYWDINFVYWDIKGIRKKKLERINVESR